MEHRSGVDEDGVASSSCSAPSSVSNSVSCEASISAIEKSMRMLEDFVLISGPRSKVYYRGKDSRLVPELSYKCYFVIAKLVFDLCMRESANNNHTCVEVPSYLPNTFFLEGDEELVFLRRFARRRRLLLVTNFFFELLRETQVGYVEVGRSQKPSVGR
jgi:hypothetical protein